MKKVSTEARKQSRNVFTSETDDRFGSGRSLELLSRIGRGVGAAGSRAEHHAEGDAGSLRRHAAQPHCAGDRNAFPPG